MDLSTPNNLAVVDHLLMTTLLGAQTIGLYPAGGAGDYRTMYRDRHSGTEWF